MTTTSQQPAAGDPNPAGQPGGGPEGGARPDSGRQGGRGWRGGVAVAAAVVVAFGVGQLTASMSSGRAADAGLRAPPPTVMRAAPSLPDGPLQLAPTRGAEVQLPPLPQLPPALQQQLAQPPRVVPPSPAPVVAGSPGALGTPSRNAFGLER